MSDNQQTWERTKLYAILETRPGTMAEEARRVLRTCLPDAERVLQSGGTAPRDFTLHDAGHSFRVAERMTDVVSPEVVEYLSDIELALLLLSAYLHDIGMTPERGKVKQVLRFLENGDEPSLNQCEKDDIQEWLDNRSAGVPGRIPHSTDGGRISDNVELLTAHYCRHRHNDWSEEWIRKNLNVVRWQGYPVGWLDDLVQLCRSHHYGYSELVKSNFDPKPIQGASSIAVVHRRYLACVLRVADILELDPERTPDIVFTHRSIAKGSEIFWHKDHYIQLVIDSSRKHIVLTAEPPNARVHRAILEMADQIDAELTLCQRLSQVAPFERLGPIPDLKHRWDLPYVVDRKIEPKAESYVYINGAFRPNTQKLLELLSGRELYGSPLAAVRELLQNAFDATKERIAREMLNANDLRGNSVFSDRYIVELTLERDNKGIYLVCKDSGVGMSKSIIENYFLVSGSAKRHDVLELERRCEKVGLRLGRTGQFGIGVLSYFMIADKVAIETHRDVSCGDADGSGWTFETEGVGGFGELRRARLDACGTRVALRLREDIIAGDATAFAQSLVSYVADNLLRVPCVFRLGRGFGESDRSFGPGWLRTEETLIGIALHDLESRVDQEPSGKRMLSSSGRRQLEEKAARWREVAQEARAALRWKILSGDLPQNAGAYRVSIPYFDLAGGNCFAFLRVVQAQGQLELKKISSGLAYIPQGHETSAWRGMQTDARRYAGHGWMGYEGFGIRELDWEAADIGTISVDRRRMELSASAMLPSSWLRDKIAEEYERLAYENRRGAFSMFNYRILDIAPCSEAVQQWRNDWNDAPDARLTWESPRFPATVSQSFAYWRWPEGLSNLGETISVIPPVGGLDDDDHYDGIGWNSSRLQPDKLLVYDRLDTQLMPVWEEQPTPACFTNNPFLCTKFPPNWDEVVGARVEHYSAVSRGATFWNIDHPLTRVLNAADWGWVSEAMTSEVDPLSVGDRILSTAGRSAAWLASVVSDTNQELWRSIVERDTRFLEAIWRAVFGPVSPVRELKFFVEKSKGIRVVSPSSWNFIAEVRRWKSDKEAKELNGDILPVVDAAWRLDSPDLGYRTRLIKPGSSSS